MEYKNTAITYSKILDYHRHDNILLLLCKSFAVKFTLKSGLPYEIFTHIKVIELNGIKNIFATYGTSSYQDDVHKTEWALNGAKIISTSEVMEELL